MAQKKSGGSSKNGRDSKPKKLGFKLFSNQYVKSGNIILRQKGNNFYAGINTKISKNYDIYSTSNGYLNFKYKNNKKIIYVI